MATRQRSIEDVNERKLQRSKIKDVEKPFDTLRHDHEKTSKCKLQPLKFVLLTIILITFITLFYSPAGYHHDPVLQPISSWLWGESDPRYASEIIVEWDKVPTVLSKIPDINKIQSIGLLNFNENEINNWKNILPHANHIVLQIDYTKKNVTWDTLYPEWIDEEEDKEVPTCPYLPKIEVPKKRIDLIVVKLPCRNEANWSRDVARLHLQISAANLAASVKWNYNVHLMFVTKCLPIPNLFSCKELVAMEGNFWLYKSNLDVLREKVTLPIGSCELALPLKVKDGDHSGNLRREAYVTILHSADVYVCGAITAAQSICMTGSTRDLVILVDETISEYHKSGLEVAGWKIRTIQRIRNPKAKKDAYNEWNYSKFRLWQLTDYDKIIFIDADLLILRNIDFLFAMPQISATGNDGMLFNSGLMVIEPSNCTFQLLMGHINEIESYNGGDQGYLNEIFTWWHRIPKHMNFLKNFWIGDKEEVKLKKMHVFGADPPVLYVLHYLGLKPWLCFRDYDCNYNVDSLRKFASDVAHDRWWRVHDAMPKQLQEFCLLRSKQKARLEIDWRQAEKVNYTDAHWNMSIHDPRIDICIDKSCALKNMVRHWGETNWTNDKSFNPTPPAITKKSLSSY